METKTFTFPDGSWWEVYQEKTWGTERAIAQAVKKFLKIANPQINQLTGVVNGEVNIDWDKWDPQEANEVLLLHSPKAWSFGVVNAEILQNLPKAQVEEVLAYLDAAYASQDPLVTGRINSALQNVHSRP